MNKIVVQFDDSSFDMHKSSPFENMPYKKQLEVKDEYLKQLFKEVNYDLSQHHIVENPSPEFYRHKVILSAVNIKKNNKFELKLGLFIEGSKQIDPKINHHIQDKEINDALIKIEKILLKYKIRAHNRFEPKGTLKHVLMRKSASTGKMLLVLVTQSTLLPNHKLIVKDIISECPNIMTVVQNIQDRETPVVLGDKDKILYGKGYIYDEIDGIEFRIHYKSFYQVNPYQMKNLYHYALEQANLNKNDMVVDTYSGIGTITLLASVKAKQVIGIEVNQNAVLDAKFNQVLNNIENVEFICDDVERSLVNIKQIDTLIMDPSRDGASRNFLETVLRIKPKKIVYISCDPKTQIRDLKSLLNDYEIKSVQGFDMFSYTAHVENVVLLSLK
ncbi:putative 23S rRNA (Uracil-5-)-methyltransferase RumA [Alteracholeplasma palmae J233]|uniref:Putative 23S rRNA (Uracil-5-)-methyltransferase RumA n=1 Tax=Alteracholeplasma palmae (strain ATCC 49389 / J233) TaxID=1318466 RepID=U4KKZ0_ALTPJ|nr:23S rRNA (uracil(1939)-C(5))-methyltransferase RlmD [Alteracholeplasma palmae]CCV64373.1 putative 23S rRNA (Uracil-5-)-methyltransferase RumA [Alteracholeplasma palmae J233]